MCLESEVTEVDLLGRAGGGGGGNHLPWRMVRIGDQRLWETMQINYKINFSNKFFEDFRYT